MCTFLIQLFICYSLNYLIIVLQINPTMDVNRPKYLVQPSTEIYLIRNTLILFVSTLERPYDAKPEKGGLDHEDLFNSVKRQAKDAY